MSAVQAGEVDRLVHYMPILVRDGGVSDWERTFCASIVSKSRRPGFKVSAKQVSVMQRLVREFQQRVADADADAGGEVLEERSA